MEGFSAHDIMQLQEIIADGDEQFAKSHVDGTIGKSVLNPGTIGESKKETAKPYAKIEAKVNNRNLGTGASKQQNNIWDTEEVKDQPKLDKRENRPRPDYDIVYK
jgi:hypothetical protein